MQKFHKRMNVPVPWCVSGLYLWLHYEMLNYTVKREMKTVIEGTFIQEKMIRQRRQVWIRIWISENWGLSLQLGLITPQGHKADMHPVALQVRPTLPISRKSLPTPNFGNQWKPMLSPLGHEGYLMRWAAGHASRCLAKSSTGSFLCSSHNLVIQSLLKGNATS